MSRLSSRRSAFSVIEILIVLGFLALLLAFFFPAVHKVRQAAARTQDQNNQRQLAIGFHSFHDVHRHMPFNGVKGSLGTPKDIGSGSWIYQLLPYIEQDGLYKNPQRAEDVKIPTLLSPGRDRFGIVTEGKFKGPQSDYAINTWINDSKQGDLSAPNRKASFVRITDGTSNTLLCGQLALRTTDYMDREGGEGRETLMFGGTMGTGRKDRKQVNDGPGIDFANRFGGPFKGITVITMCDGSVRSAVISFDLQPILTPDGGEVIGNID